MHMCQGCKHCKQYGRSQGGRNVEMFNIVPLLVYMYMNNTLPGFGERPDIYLML